MLGSDCSLSLGSGALPVEEVVVVPSVVELTPGGVASVEAIGRDRLGGRLDIAVRWTSADTAIATVSPRFATHTIVTGKAPGETLVVATHRSSGARDTVSVTVSPVTSAGAGTAARRPGRGRQHPTSEPEMKYLCLAYEEQRVLDELSEEEWHALRDETLSYVETLRESGHLLATNALRSATAASTVRVRGGETLLTDGPFAETKEQIGGYFLIEVADHAEALRIASAWPSARLGTIEVRPVEDELRLESRYR